MRAYYENHITQIQVFLELLFPTKISLLSIQFVELCRNSKKLARFVMQHVLINVQLALLKILLMYVIAWKEIQTYQFLAVHKNCDFRTVRPGIFRTRICNYAV